MFHSFKENTETKQLVHKCVMRVNVLWRYMHIIHIVVCQQFAYYCEDSHLGSTAASSHFYYYIIVSCICFRYHVA